MPATLTPPNQPLHLHGSILTATGFVPSGTLIICDGRITQVSKDRLEGAHEFDVHGLMSPGFVDVHNHAAHTVFGRWSPERKLRSRFDWRGKTRNGTYVNPNPDPYYAKNIGAPFRRVFDAIPRELYLYGQVAGVLGGATTMAIDAEIPFGDPRITLRGFVRDPTEWEVLAYGVLDISALTDESAREIRQKLEAAAASLFVHLAEGFDEFSRGEFLTLKEAKRLLTSRTSLIHAMGLLAEDWDHVKKANASVVWSPSSNFRIYGRSLDIGYLVGSGIRLALAPDWAITGSSTMLDELRFVRTHYNWFTDEQLFRMTTSVPAEILGFGTVGRLEENCFADLVVFEGTPKDREEALHTVVSATLAEVRMVFVGGTPVYGLREELSRFGAPGEPFEFQHSTGRMQRAIRLPAPETYEGILEKVTRELGAIPAPLWRE